MTVENISWSISTKECCRPRRGLNPRPPGLQSDGASNWATEAGSDQSCLAQVVHYLFLPWKLPWIILAYYGNQQQQKKKKKKKKAINNTQIRRRCMRHLIRTYTVGEFIYQIWDRQTVLIKTKKKRKKTGAFKRCILLSLSVTFDLLDTPTAPGCFAVSVYSHVSHKRINYQTTITDDSC